MIVTVDMHTLRPYNRLDLAPCLAIFDENCPAFFAPNERREYAQFLDQEPSGYNVYLLQEQIVGAFGVRTLTTHAVALNWILLARGCQGRGIGTAIMRAALQAACNSGGSLLRISASHFSAPFFAKFGAEELSRQQHGWGPDMHRVEMQIPLR